MDDINELNMIRDKIYQLANDPSRLPTEAIDLFMQHASKFRKCFFDTNVWIEPVGEPTDSVQCAEYMANSVYKLIDLGRIDLSDCNELYIAFSTQNYLLVGGIFSNMQAVLYDAIHQTMIGSSEEHNLYCELEHIWSDHRSDKTFITNYQNYLLAKIQTIFQGNVIFII